MNLKYVIWNKNRDEFFLSIVGGRAVFTKDKEKALQYPSFEFAMNKISGLDKIHPGEEWFAEP